VLLLPCARVVLLLLCHVTRCCVEKKNARLNFQTVRFYCIIDEQPRFPSRAAKAELSALAKAFLITYKSLSLEAFRNGVRFWKMTAKFHLFQHLCELQVHVNPRWSWCYADEDLQKHVKGVAKSCHAFTVSYMVLFKWLCYTFD
jgi:hypothetical protein